MIYAIVRDSKVVNIVEASGNLEADWFLVTPNSPVSIGDTYDGYNYYDADGHVRLAPDTQLMQSRIDELKAENAALKASIDGYEAAYMEGVQDA